MIEDLGPDRFVVPVILMAKEGNIRCANFGEVKESVAAMGNEVNRGVWFTRFLNVFFPAGIGLIDLGGTDVEALKVRRFGFFRE